MAYEPTSPLGGIRIFYSSSILWDSDSLLFGLNDFAKNKTNFRFSKILSPGEPSLQMIACCTRRFRSYCTMFSRVFVTSHLRFPSTVNPYENCIHLPFIQSFPVDLVITRYTEILSIVSRILYAYCLAVLAT